MVSTSCGADLQHPLACAEGIAIDYCANVQQIVLRSCTEGRHTVIVIRSMCQVVCTGQV